METVDTTNLLDGITREIISQVAMGQIRVFPPDAIEGFARDLHQRLDCSIATPECEAAVLGFVAALGRGGWKLFRPAF